MSSPTATSTALTTYELLERILLYLPIHTLFTSLRVSRAWHSVLTRSIPLQQAMFLTASGPVVKPIDSPANHDSIRTRLIYAPRLLQLNPFGEMQGLVNQPSGQPSGKRSRTPLVTFGLADLNMFLRFIVKGFPIAEDRLEETEYSSWRSMLVTQPPVTAVHYDVVRPGDAFVFGGAATIFNPEGVTLGDLQDMWVELTRRFDVWTAEGEGHREQILSFCLFRPWGGDEMEEAW